MNNETLVSCPACGRENVSRDATSCPGCGHDIKAHFSKLKMKEATDKGKKVAKGCLGCGLLFFLVLIIMILISVTINLKDKQQQDQTQQQLAKKSLGITSEQLMKDLRKDFVANTSSSGVILYTSGGITPCLIGWSDHAISIAFEIGSYVGREERIPEYFLAWGEGKFLSKFLENTLPEWNDGYDQVIAVFDELSKNYYANMDLQHREFHKLLGLGDKVIDIGFEAGLENKDLYSITITRK